MRQGWAVAWRVLDADPLWLVTLLGFCLCGLSMLQILRRLPSLRLGFTSIYMKENIAKVRNGPVAERQIHIDIEEAKKKARTEFWAE
jgi:hypothetical protein